MKDTSRRARKDSDNQSTMETPDFIFKYADSDCLTEEIAEWYTYSEEPEYSWNQKAFQESFINKISIDTCDFKKWSELTEAQRRTHINCLLDQTEINNKAIRDSACRSILYVAQGFFAECNTIEEYYKNLTENIILLYESDTFSIFTDLLLFEIDNLCSSFLIENKYAPCISDNADLRVILSVLYTMLEVIRLYDSETMAGRFIFSKELNAKYAKVKSLLKLELNKPMVKTDELLSVYLFQLINKFCNQNVIVLPIKKIILFLWKVLLFTLGGLDEAFKTKNEQRIRFNLPIIEENPTYVINQMSPATPPPNPIDLVNDLQFSNPNSSYKRKKNSNLEANNTNGLTKQTRGIDNDDSSLAQQNSKLNSQDAITENNEKNNETELDSVVPNELAETNNIENELNTEEVPVLDIKSNTDEKAEQKEAPQIGTPFPKSNSPPPEKANKSEESKKKSLQPTDPQSEEMTAAVNDAVMLKLNFYTQSKTLPWKPKVRRKELESFIDQERKKFLGYGDLTEDLETLIGLPYPIHESIKVLKQHMYISLNDEQIKLEEKLIKYPLSMQNYENSSSGDDEMPPSEILFSSLLNNLPQYLICLLKILLTSVPQTRPKTDSLQIMSDLFPEDLLGSHFLTIKLGIDTNRHKEILIKAISAIILLMLKHFKVNHVYQFEFMSQHLLFANCVPLILKFFNLNISNFIQSKNSNMHLDFPNCVIGKQPELDAEELENGDSSTFRWRNVFSCINLLRILNKLTKYKRSRVMMLVIFKSAPILKKILRVKQSMLQLYALKLLKMQTRHLGRQWRKTNMSLMSAIYQKVRHRLNDDWAFGNEQEAQAWDFQSDECALRAKIDNYIQRKYKTSTDSTNKPMTDGQNTNTAEPQQNFINEFTPTDNSILSYLNKDVKLPDDFESNYNTWLEEEVFSNKIDWDKLLIADQESKPVVLF